MIYMCTECKEIQCVSTSSFLADNCPHGKKGYHWKLASVTIVERESDDQTPNCSICKWIKSDYELKIHQVSIDVNKINSDDMGCPTNYDCMAQGGADAYGVYNSDQCKALFEVKPTEDKE